MIRRPPRSTHVPFTAIFRSLLAGVIKNLNVYEDRMLDNIELTKGLLFSQKTMLLLVEKGLTRTEAYKVVQENSMKTWDQGHDFRELIKRDIRVKDLLSEEDLTTLFNHTNYTEHTDDIITKATLR